MENKNLFEALSKAQAFFTPAELDKTNPHYKSKYASLASVQSVYRKPLADNGLSIIQNVLSIDGAYHLETILAHSSGEHFKNSFKLILGKQDMQGLGSAITYARRYGVSTILGIVADEDVDGNDTMKQDQPKAFIKREPIRPQPPKKDIPNHAPRPAPPAPPKHDNDDLDVFLDQRVDMLGELVKFTKDHNIPTEQVTNAIEIVVGEVRRANTLTDDELNSVLSFLAMKV